MKKIIQTTLSLTFILSLFTFFGCGSTDTEAEIQTEPSAPEETILSTTTSKHVTIDQSNSKIKITLHKEADEDISAIQIFDTLDESQITVPMTSETISFVWPFGENGKDYMLSANLIDGEGNSKTKEFIDIKVEGNPAAATYTEDFLNSKLVLIAKGNERVVKFNSTQDALKSVTEKLNPNTSELQINIYSGRHYNADTSKAVLVATLTKSIENKADLEEVFNGYDLISNAKVFGMTPTEMNKALSANKTYFAVATVKFPVSGLEKVSFTSRTLYSNDTIYTPINAVDLQKMENASVTEEKTESEYQGEK